MSTDALVMAVKENGQEATAKSKLEGAKGWKEGSRGP